MSELLTLIRGSENFAALQMPEESLVRSAEQTLGLVFADDYKEYVRAFGAATFDGRELTGICKSERLSVVSTTERARRFYPCFPENKYVVEELYFDHILTIQDATGAIFSYGPNDEAKQIAMSLQEYLFPNSTTTCFVEKE